MQYKPNITLQHTNPYTVTRKIIEDQKNYTHAVGDFTSLIQSVIVACKYIATKVRKAGIANLYGAQDSEEKNASGDTQRKIDVLSNEVFCNALKATGMVCCMVSEEEENAIIIKNSEGKYILAFDPLDGSSNIDCNVSIGSIFGIWKKGEDEEINDQLPLKKSSELLASGYCCYGSACQLVLCSGGDVNGYTLDPSIGEFILTHPKIMMPESGAIYSINEGNAQHWEEPITKYVQTRKFPLEGQKVHSLR